eukprot:gene2242-8531_t
MIVPMLCLLAMCTSLSGADAHVYMTTPLSRVRVLGNADWIAAGGNGLGNPIRYYPDGSFYNDKADVCGDPHQQNDQGVGGFTGAVNNPQPWSVVYSAGATIQVTQKMNAWHGGYIMIKLCPTARSGATQGCFDQYPLVSVERGITRYWYGREAGNTLNKALYPDGGLISQSWRLPQGVTCDGGCMLQLEYHTANSCVDTCSVAECGSYATSSLSRCGTTSVRKEIFRDCADIRITGSGTTAPTTNPTTTTTTGGSCPASDRPDWRCGPNFGNAKCLSGYCCSTSGWCGNTAAHCNPNVCAGSSSPSSTTTTTTTTATCGTCKTSPCAGGNNCNKCNLAQSLGGCKCDSNCNCVSGTCLI